MAEENEVFRMLMQQERESAEKRFAMVRAEQERDLCILKEKYQTDLLIERERHAAEVSRLYEAILALCGGRPHRG